MASVDTEKLRDSVNSHCQSTRLQQISRLDAAEALGNPRRSGADGYQRDFNCIPEKKASANTEKAEGFSYQSLSVNAPSTTFKTRRQRQSPSELTDPAASCCQHDQLEPHSGCEAAQALSYPNARSPAVTTAPLHFGRAGSSRHEAADELCSWRLFRPLHIRQQLSGRRQTT